MKRHSRGLAEEMLRAEASFRIAIAVLASLSLLAAFLFVRWL